MANHRKRSGLRSKNAAGFRTKGGLKPKTGSKLKLQQFLSQQWKPMRTRGIKAGVKIDIASVFQAKMALESPKAQPKSAVQKNLSSLPAPVQAPLRPPGNLITKPQPSFPAHDLHRPAFCCAGPINTHHIANGIANPYCLHIQQLMTFTAKIHSTEAIPVKDMTWQGLQTADFILELKRGRVIRQTPVTRRSHPEEHRDREMQTMEEDIEFGPGRYFVQSEEAVESFVEVMIPDLHVPWEFENVLGVCKELSCVEHKDFVFHIEIWEGMESLKKYFKA